MFLFQCQNCKAELEAQDEWDGYQTNCPNCQAEILIEKEKPAQVQVVALPEKFLFICPECGQITELEADQEGKQIECPNCAETVTAIQAEERPCPFCNEKIKLKAKVCKHCKKQVPPLTPSAPPIFNTAPALNPDEKACPKCQQVIKKQATFCRHCKQDITGQANVANKSIIDTPQDQTILQKLLTLARNKSMIDAPQDQTKRSLAYKLGLAGIILNGIGIIFFPMLGIVGLTLGLIGLSKMTPEDKQSSFSKGARFQVWVAIGGGIFCIIRIAVAVYLKSRM